MTKEKLKNAIVTFEQSSKTYQDYLTFLLVVREAFAQGIGIDGQEITEAVIEAIDVLKPSKES